MKIFKQIAAILLALCMLLSMTACGNREGGNTTAADNGKTADTTKAADTSAEPEEMVTIEFWMNAWGMNDDNTKRIGELVNKLTEKELNIHVNFTWLPSLAEYDSAVKLAIAGDTQIDVINTIFFSDYIANEMIKDLTPYVDSCLSDAKAELGDYLNSGSVLGKLYGICEYRDYVDYPCFIINQDYADAAGWTEDKVRAISSWTELEKLAADADAYLKANKPEVSIIEGSMANLMWVMDYFVLGADKFEDALSYDKLSASGMLVFTDQDGHVSNLWNQQQVVDACKRAKKWADNGWVKEDAHISGFAMGISLGTTFLSVSKSEYGVEMQQESMGSFNYTVLYGKQIPVQDSIANLVTMCVPKTSKETEAACRFINYFYKSREINNLMSWGEEGVDYKIENGAAVSADPANMNAYKVGDVIIGDWFLTTPFAPYPADFRSEVIERNKTAETSRYIGFSADSSKIATEVGNVSNVLNQYQGQLLCGLYTDDLYQTFLTELNNAGAKTIIDFYQKALDDFLAK